MMTVILFSFFAKLRRQNPKKSSSSSSSNSSSIAKNLPLEPKVHLFSACRPEGDLRFKRKVGEASPFCTLPYIKNSPGDAALPQGFLCRLSVFSGCRDTENRRKKGPNACRETNFCLTVAFAQCR